MKILYVLKRYPRLSETFVVREILGVEALGVAVVGLRRAGKAATHKFSRSELLGPGDALICHVSVEEIADLKTRAARPGA